MNDLLGKVAMKLWDSSFSKIRGLKRLNESEKLVKIWQFGDRPAHAGQIFSTKILPNGNKKFRMLTVYGNNAIGLETMVKDSSGRVVPSSAFAGIYRQNGSSEALSSTIEEVKKFAAKRLYGASPDAKRL